MSLSDEIERRIQERVAAAMDGNLIEMTLQVREQVTNETTEQYISAVEEYISDIVQPALETESNKLLGVLNDVGAISKQIEKFEKTSEKKLEKGSEEVRKVKTNNKIIMIIGSCAFAFALTVSGLIYYSHNANEHESTQKLDALSQSKVKHEENIKAIQDTVADIKITLKKHDNMLNCAIEASGLRPPLPQEQRSGRVPLKSPSRDPGPRLKKQHPVSNLRAPKKEMWGYPPRG
jgi:hypothetical protein